MRVPGPMVVKVGPEIPPAGDRMGAGNQIELLWKNNRCW